MILSKMIYCLILSVLLSTLLYFFLHKKTHISLRFLYIDNLVVIIFSTCGSLGVSKIIPHQLAYLNIIVVGIFVLLFAFILTMIRFWRVPTRKTNASNDEIVSPADGRIVYTVKVEEGLVPVSVKGKRLSSLVELTKTDLLNGPCWLIGINMTLFDVHKNCSPIDGEIIMNQHFSGEFLSLKKHASISENERNTYVIRNENIEVGVVQIASRLVRRIDSYVSVGDMVSSGSWIGMIRFGSQVDIILPASSEIFVTKGEQVYAGLTIIGRTSIK